MPRVLGVQTIWPTGIWCEQNVLLYNCMRIHLIYQIVVPEGLMTNESSLIFSYLKPYSSWSITKSARFWLICICFRYSIDNSSPMPSSRVFPSYKLVEELLDVMLTAPLESALSSSPLCSLDSSFLCLDYIYVKLFFSSFIRAPTSRKSA